VLRYNNKVVIGAYNCTFNTRAVFIYRCKSNCEGYFIRKEKWVDLINMDPDILTFIRQSVKEEYNKRIKYKVLKVKEVHI